MTSNRASIRDERGDVCAALSVLWLVACAAPNPTTLDPPTADATATSTATAIVATARPTAVMTASLAPSASSAGLSIRSATLGKIQCETVDCNLASEICCIEGSVGRCLSKASATGRQPCGAQAEQRECDETADCGGDLRCCRNFEFDTQCAGNERWSCRAKCGSSTLGSDEICLAGSTCKSGACFSRKGIVGWPREGFCPLETPALGCGAGTTCKPGEACCWDATTKTGRCVTDGACRGTKAESEPFRLFACQKPSDCGKGFDCMSGTGMLEEEFSCRHHECSFTTVIDGPFLCAALADCPKTILREEQDQQLHKLTATGCQHRADDPPSVKTCVYR